MPWCMRTSQDPRPPFHLAIPVTDIEKAVSFYLDTLGCKPGRRADRWADIDFLGHQLSLHLVDDPPPAVATNNVDGKAIPSRHFGMILSMDRWQAMADRLTERGVDFYVVPTVRFEGTPAAQATLFLRDPSGNFLEFKAMEDPEALFRAE
jgi:uncharacterized protein